MKDTWIGFLGVVLTVLAASVFAHAEMGGIREKLGRIDGILVGIGDRISKAEDRIKGVGDRMKGLEGRMAGVENRLGENGSSDEGDSTVAWGEWRNGWASRRAASISFRKRGNPLRRRSLKSRRDFPGEGRKTETWRRPLETERPQVAVQEMNSL